VSGWDPTSSRTPSAPTRNRTWNLLIKSESGARTATGVVGRGSAHYGIRSPRSEPDGPYFLPQACA